MFVCFFQNYIYRQSFIRVPKGAIVERFVGGKNEFRKETLSTEQIKLMH